MPKGVEGKKGKGKAPHGRGRGSRRDEDAGGPGGGSGRGRGRGHVIPGEVAEASDDVNVDMELALERSLQRRLPPKEKSQEQVVFSCFQPSLGLFGGRGCISAATVTLGLWPASASFFSVSAALFCNMFLIR